MKRKHRLTIMLALVGSVLLIGQSVYALEKPKIPEIPQHGVRAVQEPYYSCSISIIGIEKGWFKELGITFLPEPHGKVVTGAETVPMLASKTIDMIDQPSIFALGAIKDLPPVKVFVYDNIFFGYAVLGQPEYKSVEEFTAEGFTHAESIEKAVAQMEGKRMGYDGSPSARSFIATVLGKSGLSLTDTELSAFEDPELQAMMLTGELDFADGMGLPALQTLTSKGMKKIVSASDIVKTAKATADSPELRTVYEIGWTTYDSFIEEHYDTILRFSSVVWRIARFVNEHQDEAIRIHLPFVNSISGTRNTYEQIKFSHDVLDPFVTFEEQWRWFFDTSYPLYEDYVLGSFINGWVEAEYLEPGEVKPSDITIARKVYIDMLHLRDESYLTMNQTKRLIEKAEKEAKVSTESLDQANSLLARASYFYENYDYLDASRFAKAAKEWIEYGLSE